MKSIISLLLLSLFIMSCSNLKLSNRYFQSNDSIRINSFHFINDSLCLYKQDFVIEMPKGYQSIIIKCDYRTESNKRLVLKNLCTNQDSAKANCFSIPENVLNEVSFFQSDTIHSNILIIDKPPDMMRRDIYGYFNNITIDTMKIKAHKIIYGKRIDCCKYYMFVSMKFKELKISK
jgi:hypothetical protein